MTRRQLVTITATVYLLLTLACIEIVVYEGPIAGLVVILCIGLAGAHNYLLGWHARGRLTGRGDDMKQKFSPTELAERTLGNGIHPLAINRLMELCPSAVVCVTHRRPIEVRVGGKRWEYRCRGSWVALKRARDEGFDARFASHGGSTEVTIAEGPELPPTAKAVAVCHPGDPFCRAVGRALAFNRALERFNEVSVFGEEDARGIATTTAD